MLGSMPPVFTGPNAQCLPVVEPEKLALVATISPLSMISANCVYAGVPDKVTT